jgi:hypothetical protein
MDLTVGKEFMMISIGIFIIFIIGIIITSLYEIILPTTINNNASGIITFILLIIIGSIFYFIPDTEESKDTKTKDKKLNFKFIVYLLLLLMITLFNLVI